MFPVPRHGVDFCGGRGSPPARAAERVTIGQKPRHRLPSLHFPHNFASHNNFRLKVSFRHIHRIVPGAFPRVFVALDGDSVLPRRASHARSRYFFRRERSAWKRRGELTAANPSIPSLPQHHGVQGRFHLLLHLRVRQRGSPRQARGPGARPIDGLLMSLATRAHRPLCRRSLVPSSGDAATPRPSNRPSSDGPTSSLVLPSHYRSPMPCSTRASPRTPTPRCVQPAVLCHSRFSR